jgi:DNA-binding transcriptional MerR regulator
MTLREIQTLVRKLGGQWVDLQAATIDLLILGADAMTEPPTDLQERCREICNEAELWQRLGMLEEHVPKQRLYTPAMIAASLNISVAHIRRWYQRGWLEATRTVHRLPLFSFAEINVCQQITQLLASGVTEHTLQRRLQRLATQLPDVERPLAQLELAVEGRSWLVRCGEHLQEPSGQRRFDFSDETTDDDDATGVSAPVILSLSSQHHSNSVPSTLNAAEQYEASGDLEAAVECYRAALAASGVDAETNARLADCLYRLGDLTAARERFSMALELDENFLEARVSLGCVFAELGQSELAVAAWQGALTLYPDHPDAHFHLAKLLDARGERTAAEKHWRRFVALAAESPWLALAEQRLEGVAE